MDTKMWQLCPKCNGSGTVIDNYYGNFQSGVCDLCCGSKLISLLTGLPPYKVTTQTSDTTNLIVTINK
jgi:DnaJ-class molecular chaperone